MTDVTQAASPGGASPSAIEVTRFGLATIAGPDGPYLAVMTDHGVVGISDLLGEQAPTSVLAMLPDWDDHCDAISAALAADGTTAHWVSPSELKFEPPLPDPGAIYCSGANFYDHIAEMGKEPPDKDAEDAYHFMVAPSTLTGHHQPVIRPRGVENLDWEVELVAVIGRRARAVTAEEALDYVAGYTVVNDISVRQPSIFHHIFGVRWIPSKGLATMNPMGPSIVPARFVPDPLHLNLSTHVNGEVRQDSNTDQMIWTVQEQIASLSAGLELRPGDLILTGTPAGTAAAYGRYLADGDVVTVAVEGIGTLENTIEPWTS